MKKQVEDIITLQSEVDALLDEKTKEEILASLGLSVELRDLKGAVQETSSSGSSETIVASVDTKDATATSTTPVATTTTTTASATPITASATEKKDASEIPADSSAQKVETLTEEQKKVEIQKVLSEILA